MALSTESFQALGNSSITELDEIFGQIITAIGDRDDNMEVINHIEANYYITFEREADGQTPKICRKRPN